MIQATLCASPCHCAFVAQKSPVELPTEEVSDTETSSAQAQQAMP